MHSSIALYKTYTKTAIHKTIATTNAAFGSDWKALTDASGVIELNDSSGNPLDANWCHIVAVTYGVATAQNKVGIILEPSGVNRTEGNDNRNKYAVVGLQEGDINLDIDVGVTSSGCPGVLLYPTVANSGNDSAARDEHTWHFPTGGVSEFRYTTAYVTGNAPTGTHHLFLIITYGKEYPENHRRMIEAKGGDPLHVGG